MYLALQAIQDRLQKYIDGTRNIIIALFQLSIFEIRSIYPMYLLNLLTFWNVRDNDMTNGIVIGSIYIGSKFKDGI